MSSMEKISIFVYGNSSLSTSPNTSRASRVKSQNPPSSSLPQPRYPSTIPTRHRSSPISKIPMQPQKSTLQSDILCRCSHTFDFWEVPFFIPPPSRSKMEFSVGSLRSELGGEWKGKRAGEFGYCSDKYEVVGGTSLLLLFGDDVTHYC